MPDMEEMVFAIHVTHDGKPILMTPMLGERLPRKPATLKELAEQTTPMEITKMAQESLRQRT